MTLSAKGQGQGQISGGDFREEVLKTWLNFPFLVLDMGVISPNTFVQLHEHIVKHTSYAKMMSIIQNSLIILGILI